jgi:hypothetical protein
LFSIDTLIDYPGRYENQQLAARIAFIAGFEQMSQ